MKKLKILVVGYGELVSGVLLGILDTRHEVVGFYNWENTKKGKKSLKQKFFEQDKAKDIAKNHNLNFIKAPSVNSEQFKEITKELDTDIILVASWGEILKTETINSPKLACINCHPSLLPKHRGSNPYFSTIRNNEKESGITFHYIDEGIDTGDIILQAKTDININDTSASLRDKCAYLAKSNISNLLNKIEKNQIYPVKQDNDIASYYPRIKSEDIKIDWHKSSVDIHNQIRALRPWMKAFCYYKNEIFLIGTSQIIDLDHNHKPGIIIDKYNNNFVIATKDRDKALLVSDLSFYTPLSFIWQDFCIKNFIKKGTRVY